ncbi:MAG: hypothetical protein HC905_17140 [Bacteroidales bacterium]|nr:hypothetical protein [Bacteroidales bacterium]
MMKRLLYLSVLIWVSTVSAIAQINIASTSYTDVTCNGSGDGTITVNINDAGTPANPPYTYELRNFSDLSLVKSQSTSNLTTTFTSLTPGTYIVRVVDSHIPINAAFTGSIVIADGTVLNGGTIGSDQSICTGVNPAAFTDLLSPAGGSGVWAYDWEYQENCSGVWIALGVNALVYDPPVIPNTRCYRRKATRGACGSEYSNIVTITVNTPPSGGGDIGIAGADAITTICHNTDPAAFASVTAASGGSPVGQYVWQYTTNMAAVAGDGNWTDIASSNSTSFDYNVALTVNTRFIRKYYNTCGAVYSDIIRINVSSPVVQGSISNTMQGFCVGSADPPAFSVTAPTGGTGAWTYQWQRSANGTSAWQNLVTTAGYDPSSINQTWFYRRIETNSCGTFTSPNVEIREVD